MLTVFIKKLASSVIAAENITYCCGSASEMTYIVSSGALNSTHSLLLRLLTTQGWS